MQHHCDIHVRDFDYNQNVLSILAERNIITVQDYINYGRENFDPADNIKIILLMIQRQMDNPVLRAHNIDMGERDLLMVNVGRIHESLKLPREMRAQSIRKFKKKHGINFEKESKRCKIVCRGAVTCIPKESSDLEKSIEKKSFIEKAMAPTIKTLPKLIRNTPEKDLDEMARDLLFDLSLKWKDHSHFFRITRSAGLSTEDIRTNLGIAAKAHIRYAKTIMLYCKKLQLLADFLEKRGVPYNLWTGEESIFFIGEFLRSCEAPTAAHLCKTAFKFIKNVLGFDWNLEHPIILNSAKMKNPKPIKQAPAFEAFQVKEFEKIASSESQPSGLRILCSGVALMTHASLRWGDTLAIPSITLKDGVISGTISSSKTASHPTEFCCTEKGFKSLFWSHPIFKYRELYKKKFAKYPDFIFPSITKDFKELLIAAPKRQIEKLMRDVIFKIGVPSGKNSENYTLHSPRNFYVNGASQLGWTNESQTILGRWSKNSKMPEHYCRSSGALELQIRNDLASRVRKGWEPKGKHQIPMPPPASNPHSGRTDTTLSSSVNQVD